MSEHREIGSRFTDQQVSAILKRAAQLQAERAGAVPGPEAGSGISLAQLQQAAAELGIEPRLIEEAAAEVEGGHSGESQVSLWGGPWAVQIERAMEGEVAEEEWPAMLQEIRRASGRVGRTSTVGKSFEWMSTSPDLIGVTVIPHNGQTSVNVISRCGDWGLACYMPPLIFTAMASLVLSKTLGWPPLADLGLTAALFGGVFTLARTGFNAICRRREWQAHKVMRALESFFAQRQEAEQPAVAPVKEYASPAEPEKQTLGQTHGVV